jgi:hypothetical protein
MGTPQSGREILDREFLATRAKILEIAAALDRVSRADDGAVEDPRWAKLHTAMELVLKQSGDRAEQVQLLFSRACDAEWRVNFDLK